MHMYLHACTSMCLDAHTFTSKHTHAHACTCIHTQAHPSAWMHLQLAARMHMPALAFTQSQACACTCINVRKPWRFETSWGTRGVTQMFVPQGVATTMAMMMVVVRKTAVMMMMMMVFRISEVAGKVSHQDGHGQEHGYAKGCLHAHK